MLKLADALRAATAFLSLPKIVHAVNVPHAYNNGSLLTFRGAERVAVMWLAPDELPLGIYQPRQLFAVLKNEPIPAPWAPLNARHEAQGVWPSTWEHPATADQCIYTNSEQLRVVTSSLKHLPFASSLEVVARAYKTHTVFELGAYVELAFLAPAPKEEAA